MNLAGAFRVLREAWFMSHVHQHPSERQWEEEHDERWRERTNQQAKEKFDVQTEAIIQGKDHVITPRCPGEIV